MPKRSSNIELVVKTAVDKAIKDLNLTEKEIDDLAESGKKADGHFKALGASVKAFISALAIKEAVEFTFEIEKMAARADTVHRAFVRRFGAEATAVLKELRENTKGAVTDLDLMINAIQAQKLGASIDTLRTFSKFARMEAAEQGANTLEVFSNIISGVLRGSTELLDNFGISLTELNKTIEIMAVEKMGKAESSLSAVERRIISVDAAVRIMNDRLAQTDLSEITDAEKIQSVSTAWNNLQINFGKFATTVLDLPQAMQNVANLLEGINRTFEVKNLQNYTEQMQENIKQQSKLYDLLEKYEGKEGTKGYQRLQRRLKTLQDEQDLLNQQYGYLDKNQQKTDDLTNSVEKYTYVIKTKMAEAIKYFDPIFSRAIDKVNQKLESQKADEPLLLIDDETIKKQDEKIEEIAKSIIDKYNNIADTIDDIFVSPMESMVEDILRGTKSAESIWDQFLDNLSDSINSWLASKVVEAFISFIADLFTEGLFSSITNEGGSSAGMEGITGSTGGSSSLPSIDIGTSAAPSIGTASLNQITREINNNTIPIVGKIVVESAAPDTHRIKEFYIDINRTINMPDQDYVNATRRTKTGEFD